MLFLHRMHFALRRGYWNSGKMQGSEMHFLTIELIFILSTAFLACRVMHTKNTKTLQKTQNMIAIIKHIHLALVYIEKQWKYSGMENHVLCEQSIKLHLRYTFD